MKKKWYVFSFLCIICFILIMSFEIHNQNKLNEEDLLKSNITTSSNQNINQNKFYYIYLKQNNKQHDSSFVPKKLNPNYKEGDNLNITINYNEYGEIVEDDKMILVYDKTLSEKNKIKIKDIVGESHYEEALNEIFENINDIPHITN